MWDKSTKCVTPKKPPKHFIYVIIMFYTLTAYRRTLQYDRLEFVHKFSKGFYHVNSNEYCTHKCYLISLYEIKINEVLFQF